MKTCRICKVTSSSYDGNVLMYRAPKDMERRQVWASICGFEINKNTYICQKHFEKGSLRDSPKNKGLKQNAVPRLFLERKSSCELEEKQSHPRNIASNNSDLESSLIDSNLLRLQMKTEPLERQQIAILINEEQFDKQICLSNNSKNESSYKRRTCGRVEVMDKNGTLVYNLNCICCETNYVISEWSEFVLHVENEYKLLAQSGELETVNNVNVNSVNIDDNIKRELSTKNCERTYQSLSDCEKETLLSESNPILCENMSHVSKSEQNPKIVGYERNVINLNDIYNGNDNETKELYENSSEESNNSIVDNLLSEENCSHLEEKSEQQNNSIAQLSFETSDVDIVKNFLGMMKSYPILWHRRLGSMNLFDAAVNELCSKFNGKYKCSFTNVGIRESIGKMKIWYRRLKDQLTRNHGKNNFNQTAFSEYFELCTELETNSRKIVRNCNNCNQILFSDVDLQVHLFKKHRIGELPFKCQRCKYSCTSSDKLAEHEQKHNRKRNFFCDICKQGFYYESMLKSHTTTHTGDHKLVCEICGKKFPTPSKYNRHKLHHGDPSEKCKVCGKAFFEKWTLSEHMKSHLNKRQYECNICYKQFNRYNGLTIHRRGVHKIQSAAKGLISLELAAASIKN